MVVLSIVATGCSSVDNDVAKSADKFWVSPTSEVTEKKEIPAKNEQCKECGNFIKPPECASVPKPLDLVGKKLDIPMLFDIAFENSPVTRKSWHGARIAAAQSGKAASVFFPRVTISGVGEKVESNSPPGVKNAATDFYPAIEVQYSIFQFGGHKKSADAAKQLLYAANYQHNRALQTLARDVQRCYFALDSAECDVEASQRNLDDASAAYDASFVRNQTGLSNVQDFLQARAAKAKAEFDLENAKSRVESARANLANIIGIPVSDALQIARSNMDIDVKDFVADVQELIDQTLRTRDDVLALQAILESRKDATWTATSKVAPELVIGASANRKYYKDFNGGFNNHQVHMALRWTVFDGFNNVYDIIESKEKLKQAEQDLRQLKLGVATEVWSKYHAFKAALRQLSAAKNYEHVAGESFDASAISYKNGLSSFNDLMTAQTQLAQARQQTVAAKNNLAMAVVDLAYVVGVTNFEGGSNAKN
jgi:outer membrane protein TolC